MRLFPPSTDRKPPAPSGRLLAWQLLALFLVVAGARFWLVGQYGFSAPFSDQYDAELMRLVKPWLEHTLRFADLFAPHNQHRVFTTRVVTLGLFLLNGQWDNAVEMAFNAVFCAASAVGVAGVMVTALGGAFRRLILPAVAIIYVLPFGWENTFTGFASQNYFINSFSLLAAWGLATHRANTAGWWLGVLGLILATLSMAGGFLAALAVLALLGLRLVREQRWAQRDEGSTAAVCVAGCFVGWLTYVNLPNEPLKADSMHTFLWAWAKFSSWPLYRTPWFIWPALTAPVLLLLSYLFGKWSQPGKPDLRCAELGLVGLGWTSLQTAALAYGRGGHGAFVAPRYMDLLSSVPLLGLFVWLTLIRRARGSLWRVPAVVGALLWGACILYGLKVETDADVHGWLPGWQQNSRLSIPSVRGYVATHDFARYLAGRLPGQLPYPAPERLAQVLDDATLRPYLPADIRLPIHLQPTGEPGRTAFVPDGYNPACGLPEHPPAWGSYVLPAPGAHQGDFQARLASPARLPYLRFQFSGYLGKPGLKFSLQDSGTNQTTVWQPKIIAGQHWHQEDVPVPGQALRVEGSDHNETRWFAFDEPVELGAWSRWTGFLLRQGGKIFFAGCLLALGLELLFWLGTRGQRE